jgi:hypothetical protein
MPNGRRDDRQPQPGPVHRRGTGTGARTRPSITRPPGAARPPRSPPLEQHAPPGVGIKDLRPLRGRPCGPILDPDASARRAQNRRRDLEERSGATNRGLTGPAPSGMTREPLRPLSGPLRGQATGLPFGRAAPPKAVWAGMIEASARKRAKPTRERAETPIKRPRRPRKGGSPATAGMIGARGASRPAQGRWCASRNDHRRSRTRSRPTRPVDGSRDPTRGA